MVVDAGNVLLLTKVESCRVDSLHLSQVTILILPVEDLHFLNQVVKVAKG